MYTHIRRTPLYVLVPLILAVFIPCSIVVLVPIDLVSSSKHSKTTLFYLSEEIRLALWRFIYWLAFFLTWAVLPMLQSFMDSGYHSTILRLKDAASENLKYQLVMLVTGLVGLIYVVVSSGLTFSSVKALVIALSHSYALVIALWLMGHGLVNLPRIYWSEAVPGVALKAFYKHATFANDTIAEAQSDYADVAAEVLALGNYKEGRYQTWIEDMLEEIETGPGVPLNSANNTDLVFGQSRVRIERSTINQTYLATLSRRLKTARNRLIRYDADWQKMLFEASKAEDIVNSRDNESLVFRYKKTILPPKAAYVFYSVIQPQFQRVLAIVLMVLSVILVWSEITHGTIVSIVNLAVSNSYGIWQQLVSSLFLGYMCSAAFSSLSRIRVFKVYALVHRHSDMSSLIFYAMYACRLTVPLSYNYITMISSRESVFEEFLGKFINLTPLGKYFNDWLPRFILIPMIFALFHVYDRVRDFFGFGLSFDDEAEEEGEERGTIVEGRELIKRALTDPSYRYSLRHPNISIVADSSMSSASSGGSGSQLTTPAISTILSSTRTSPSHLNQLLGAGGSHRQLQLGGGQVHRTRLHDQTVVVGTGRIQNPLSDLNTDEGGLDSKMKSFFTSIGDRLQSRFMSRKPRDLTDNAEDDSSGLLPRWSKNRPVKRYQDEEDD